MIGVLKRLAVKRLRFLHKLGGLHALEDFSSQSLFILEADLATLQHVIQDLAGNIAIFRREVSVSKLLREVLAFFCGEILEHYLVRIPKRTPALREGVY